MAFSLVLTGESSYSKEHCCAEMSEQANMDFPEAKSPLLGSTDKRVYQSPIGQKDVAASKAAMITYSTRINQESQARVTPLLKVFVQELQAAQK